MGGEEPRTDTLKVLGFAGSLRKGSLNKGLLRVAQDLAPSGIDDRAVRFGDDPPLQL